MLTRQKKAKPEWTWLPDIQNTEIYTWALYRLEEEKYWQIAWSEYRRRRLQFQKGYKGKPSDVTLWQEIGREMYRRMTDPQLLIEQIFVHHLKQENPRPPEVNELLNRMDTIGLWFDETYRPDAESDLYIAGTKLEVLVTRFKDNSVDYWLGKSPEDYPAYFHLLYRSSGELPKHIALRGLKELNYLHTLRSLEEFEIWPTDAQEKLLAARRHL